MPYRYLDEISIADIAFEARGESLEETFRASADATLNVMVEELHTIRPRVTKEIRLENEALDLLLFNLLQELIYYKDAQKLLLRVKDLEIRHGERNYELRCVAVGEEIDPGRHPLRLDVKAVTLHRFALVKEEQGWKATAILDV